MIDPDSFLSDGQNPRRVDWQRLFGRPLRQIVAADYRRGLTPQACFSHIVQMLVLYGLGYGDYLRRVESSVSSLYANFRLIQSKTTSSPDRFKLKTPYNEALRLESRHNKVSSLDSFPVVRVGGVGGVVGVVGVGGDIEGVVGKLARGASYLPNSWRHSQ